MKIFDNRGFLTEEAKNSKVISNLRANIVETLDGLTSEEIKIVGCVLQKMVADIVSESIQNKL